MQSHPIRRRFSIRTKVFVILLGIGLTLLGAITAFFGREQMRSARASLVDKSLNYGKLASRQLEPAVVFDDHEVARDILGGLAIDPDVKAAALYAADGRLVERYGEGAEYLANASSTPTVSMDGKRIRCAAPVVSARAHGMVIVEMSTAGLDRRMAAIRVSVLAVFVAGIALSLIAAWAAGRYLARRVYPLAQNAESVAAGRFDGLVQVKVSSDELGDLARSFGTMTENLQRLIAQNANRTEALAARNVEMRTLLDHVAQGFLTIDGTGELGPERSAIVEQWFGKLPPRVTLSELVGRADPEQSAWFDMSWEEVGAGVLPVDVALAQLPRTIEHGDRVFDMQITPIIVRADVLSTALVVITDVTEARERERTSRAREEIVALLGRALEDRAALAEFLDESSQLVDAIVRETLATPGDVKRAIHTLKGNCGLFGLASVASCCHQIETRMAELQDGPTASDRRELRERWSAATGGILSVFSRGAKDVVEVTRRDLEALAVTVTSDAPRADVARKVRALGLEPLASRLQRIGEGAEALAERLEKRLEIDVRARDIRFDTSAWSPFWNAFTHVIRNAVDHGIEEPSARVALGKASVGKLTFDAFVDAESFVLSVHDDGRGVDWPAVTAKAAALGLPFETEAERAAALFVDGLSSKRTISDLSGRGVGLGAVRAACDALGGRVSVESTRGHGTTFTFAFPVATLGDAYVEAAFFEGDSGVHRVNSVAAASFLGT